MMKKLLIMSFLMLVFSVRAEDANVKKFSGTWYIDVAKTLEAAKKDPRSAGIDPKNIKQGIEMMAAMLTFQVTDKSISYVTDMSVLYPNAKTKNLPKSPEFPYTLVNANDKSMTIKFTKGNNQGEMVFSLLDAGHMEAKSNESPEYNHVVWQRDKVLPPARKADVKKAVPEKDIIAIVLDQPISVKESKQMKGIIFGLLLQKFAKDNKIEAAEAEIDSFVKKMEESKKEQKAENEKEKKKLTEELKDKNISAKKRKEKEKYLAQIEELAKMEVQLAEELEGQEEQVKFMERQMAKQFVQSWKVNKALYDKYGGRVIFQQAGPEPLDAYRDFLKEQEKNGAFKIIDKKYEPGFWRYFINDKMHTFYPKEEGEKFITTPWWMMKKN